MSRSSGQALTLLERLLVKRGICSRQQARSLIREGQVEVDGRICLDPQRRVPMNSTRLRLLKAAPEAESWRTILFHKPRGCVTTRSDEQGRRTIYDVLGPLPQWLAPVGRLDMATSGLLLLTNDMPFSDFITDPKNGIPRDYLVELRGRVSSEVLEALRRDGVVDEGERLRLAGAEIKKESGRESLVEVTLKEGKNREIRRIFAALGFEILSLKRISFGGLRLPRELAPGSKVELSRAELAAAFPRAPLGTRTKNDIETGLESGAKDLRMD